MAAPLPGPYEGRRHEVFVCHAGDESKEVVAWPFKRALEARSQLKVFVDEADLRPGAPSIENIKAALANCKVAVVVFGPRFFESQYCLEELEMVVELGQVQCKFIYLPVFLWLTVGEVKERALDHGGRNFADRVVRTTGIRHQGDIISGRDKMVDETVNQVCNQVQNMLEAASAQGPAIITPTKWVFACYADADRRTAMGISSAVNASQDSRAKLFARDNEIMFGVEESLVITKAIQQSEAAIILMSEELLVERISELADLVQAWQSCRLRFLLPVYLRVTKAETQQLLSRLRPLDSQAMSNILGLGCILYKGEFESGTFHPQRPETLQSRIAQAVTQWRV